MKVVYVAGPFRGPTQWDIAENIRAAERMGLVVAQCGAMPLIPHANTAHFHGQMDERFWVAGTLSLLVRCDAALFLPSWRASAGSRGEWECCDETGIPRLDLSQYQPWQYREAIMNFVNSFNELSHAQKGLPEEQRAPHSSAAHGAGEATRIDAGGLVEGGGR